MRKLRLEVEALHVESFETLAGAHAARGTVRGRETEETGPAGPATTQETTSGDEIPSNDSCYTCNNTCLHWCTEGPHTH